MAEPSRGLQISRRGWLLAGLVAPLFPARAADPPLIVGFDGDNLHISSFGVHFLRGNSLKHLKDGSTVVYVVTVALYSDPFVNLIRRSEFRFVVSYDVLGTDQFQVTAPGPPPRKGVNLSLSGTETWCFENVLVPAKGLAQDRQFWLQLDLRTASPKLYSVLGEFEHSAFFDLVEIFTSPGADEHQTFKTGALRLMDLYHKGRIG